MTKPRTITVRGKPMAVLPYEIGTRVFALKPPYGAGTVVGVNVADAPNKRLCVCLDEGTRGSPFHLDDRTWGYAFYCSAEEVRPADVVERLAELGRDS